MAENRGMDRVVHAPQALGKYDRCADFVIVRGDCFIPNEEVTDLQMKLLFFFPKEEKQNKHLNDSCRERTDGCASDAHARKPEITENEHPVDAAVYQQSTQRQIECYLNRFGTPENRQEDRRNAEKRICEANDLKILSTF